MPKKERRDREEGHNARGRGNSAGSPLSVTLATQALAADAAAALSCNQGLIPTTAFVVWAVAPHL